MPITMKEIARMSGKSYPVISSVLNGKTNIRVSTATRNNVLKLARELNYLPNHHAKSLKTGKTNMIGIASSSEKIPFEGSIYPYFQEVSIGIGNYYNETSTKFIHHRYHSEDPYNESLEILRGNIVDGVIYVLYSEWISDFQDVMLSTLEKFGKPFVAVHSLSNPLEYPSIGYNSVQAGLLAAEHFIKHGYKHIGFVTREGVPHYADLIEGFSNTLYQNGLNLDPSNVFRTNGFEFNEGYNLANGILSVNQKLPEALFVLEDTLAYGMMKRFRQAGINVPGDIAIIGFDDNLSTKLIDTGLTSVKNSGFKKGFAAAQMLDDLIKSSKESQNDITKIIEPTITIRESCGCKPNSIA